MRIFDRSDNPEENFKIDLPEQFSNTNRVLPQIDSLIDLKQRKIFIKKLFDNREEDYRGFIQYLETITDWKETYKAVEAELLKRKIHLTKNEAILFTNILFQRFYH